MRTLSSSSRQRDTSTGICSDGLLDGKAVEPMLTNCGLGVHQNSNIPFSSCPSMNASPVLSQTPPLTVVGHNSDGQPHVGPIPKKPNQYILAGFVGHGIPIIFLAAKGLAEMIRNDETTSEQTGLPRVYKTT